MLPFHYFDNYDSALFHYAGRLFNFLSHDALPFSKNGEDAFSVQ